MKGFSAPSPPPHSPIVPFTTHFLLLCDPAIEPPCTYLTPLCNHQSHPCFIHRCCIHLYTPNACLPPPSSLYAICILCSAHYLLSLYSHHTIVIIIFSFFQLLLLLTQITSHSLTIELQSPPYHPPVHSQRTFYCPEEVRSEVYNKKINKNFGSIWCVWERVGPQQSTQQLMVMTKSNVCTIKNGKVHYYDNDYNCL